MAASLAITRGSTSRGRRIAFKVSAVVAVLMFGGLFAGVPSLVTTWFTPDPEGHRIHGLTHGITSGILIAGAFLALLVAPERRIALAQQAALTTALLLVPYVTAAAIGAGPAFEPVIVIFMLLAVAAAGAPIALHPSRSAFFSRGDVSVPLLVVAAAAGAAAALYAAGQLQLQVTSPAGEVHAEAFHYGGAAFAAVAVAAVALLASLRTPGWRITAWMAGVSAIVFGAGGILYPEPLSSLGTTAGAATILLGAAFIVLAEREAAR